MRVGHWIVIAIVLIMPFVGANIAPGEYTNYCQQQLSGTTPTGCTLVVDSVCTGTGFLPGELLIVTDNALSNNGTQMTRSSTQPFCPTLSGNANACATFDTGTGQTTGSTLAAQVCCIAEGVVFDRDDYDTSLCCGGLSASQVDPSENTWRCGNIVTPPAVLTQTFWNATCTPGMIAVEQYTVGVAPNQQNFTHACINGAYISEESSWIDGNNAPYPPINITIPLVTP